MVWTAYPILNYTNTSFYGTIQYANAVTGGLMGMGLVLAIWFVFFIPFIKIGAKGAFSGASFITFLITIILWSVKLVDEKVVIVLGIMLGASVALLFID